MIYTVTLNPAVDCAMELADYCAGRVNRAETQNLTAGGKGINMSIVLSRLGIETMALGFSGGDTGKLLSRLLDRAGCPHDLTELDGQLTRINMKLRCGDEETEINGKGPDIGAKELSEFMKMLSDTVKPGDTLILAGSVPSSVPSSIYADIMRLFAGEEVRIIADTSGKLLSELLEMKPFLIKPNNFELGEICGCEINTRAQAFEGAAMLQKMGARNVLVSLAGEGAVLLCEDGSRYEIKAPEGKVKNSVGAGDSMVAGFLAGLELFGDSEKALALGTAAGSATAFSEFLAEKREIAEIFHRYYPGLQF
ncbi:MAG: 1-phosphofructokinase [Ruminococcus sp.]|nr:1-phosphofructokinase [Ruminococcus sp.]